jgi:hypothetical protein
MVFTALPWIPFPSASLLACARKGSGSPAEAWRSAGRE